MVAWRRVCSEQTWSEGGRFSFLNKTLKLYSGQGRRLAQGSRISGIGGRIVPKLSSLRGMHQLITGSKPEADNCEVLGIY